MSSYPLNNRALTLARSKCINDFQELYQAYNSRSWASHWLDSSTIADKKETKVAHNNPLSCSHSSSCKIDMIISSVENTYFNSHLKMIKIHKIWPASTTMFNLKSQHKICTLYGQCLHFTLLQWELDSKASHSLL